ncbi:hypothetical protein HNP46_006502 [Pseudomonas nitritireducens]|uniref:Uncharacterized protein n=1 Tax=Pseudomonas nitroreducens TaxID=46680 RepID=A0A7W7KSL7_PSENT|nr:hypothetical protein [Pseudomonas nitritireducens]MBB4867588.1 hypothetical protein [Pseudomonas nitritireducens]
MKYLYSTIVPESFDFMDFSERLCESLPEDAEAVYGGGNYDGKRILEVVSNVQPEVFTKVMANATGGVVSAETLKALPLAKAHPRFLDERDY